MTCVFPLYVYKSSESAFIRTVPLNVPGNLGSSLPLLEKSVFPSLFPCLLFTGEEAICSLRQYLECE